MSEQSSVPTRSAWQRLLLFRGDLAIRYRACFWTLAALSGFLQASRARHRVFGDGVSYLDMGDVFFARGWHDGVNTCWSPLYAWLIVLPNHVFGIPTQWESVALHAVNFAIWVGVIVAFELMVGMVIRRCRASANHGPAAESVAPWVIRLFCYSVFLYAGAAWLNTDVETPDLLVEGAFYSAVAVAASVHEKRRLGHAVVLGVLLGAGYLAKTILFPIAPVFLWTALFRRPIAAPTRIVAALGSFALICAPLVLTLSAKVGRPSIGEAGRLNYLWSVNHLEKWPPRQGVDRKHTLRPILNDPVVYEFDADPGASVPPWFAPYDFHGGQPVVFDARQQLAALRANLGREARLLLGAPELMAFLLVVWLCRSPASSSWRGLARQIDLLAPALVMLSFYALVAVQARYVAPALVVLLIGALASIAVRASERICRLIASAVVVMAMIAGIRVVGHAREDIKFPHGTTGRSVSDDWLVAERLRELGIRPGDRVGSVGHFFDSYWARLAGVQIVASVPNDRRGNQWTRNPGDERRVLDALKRADVRVVVARLSDAYVFSTEWERVPGTPFVVRRL